MMSILNAACKVFGSNKYNRAPMSEIAEEVSFHIKDKYKIYENSDFFEILKEDLER